MSYAAAVIIPTRGGAAKLHYPLDALETQTEKNFQVIVVIDGDIDGSAQVVQSYIDRGKLNLSMIVFEQNQGRVAALNAGHRAADADILIRCDDDIEMESDYIANHLKYHTGDGEVGVMGLVHNLYPDTPHARAYGYSRDKKFRQAAYATAPDRQWNFWAANCSMSRKAYEQTGGYDTRYRTYGWEDVDMGKMLDDLGVTMVLAPDLEVKHHIAATTTAGRARRALYSGAAKHIFLEKHGNQVLPAHKPSGLWGAAVRGLALILNDKTIQALGEGIDKIADRLPHKVAEKLMALLVESASYAGQEHPQRAQAKF